jgi:hypothetical protein
LFYHIHTAEHTHTHRKTLTHKQIHTHTLKQIHTQRKTLTHKQIHTHTQADTHMIIIKCRKYTTRGMCVLSVDSMLAEPIHFPLFTRVSDSEQNTCLRLKQIQIGGTHMHPA